MRMWLSKVEEGGPATATDSVLRARDDAADARLLADMVDGFLWGESVRGVDRGPEEKEHDQNTGDPTQREIPPLGGQTIRISRLRSATERVGSMRGQV